GTAAGAGNIIANSSGPGIRVGSGTGNSIRGNSIYNSGVFIGGGSQIGIDLGFDGGVTPNDNLDGDTGGNGLQNYPVFTAASVGMLSGTLNSVPSQNYTVDFYSNPSCHASAPNDYGEGQTYLGTVVTSPTDANGNVGFNFIPVNLNAGLFVTATATDPAGNTSEFSRCRVVAAIQPSITVPNTILNFGTVTAGNTSAVQSFNVTGANLQGDITVNGPGSPFLISSSPSSGFGNSVVLTQNNGSVSANVYVKFAPASSTNGVPIQLTISASSPGAVTQNNPRVSGIGAAAACAVQPTGMVTWYPAPGNALDVRSGNNGSFAGTPTFTAGKVGQAFDVSGGNFISAPDSPGLRPSSVTIEGWFNFNDNSVSQFLMGKPVGNGTNDSYNIYYQPGFLKGSVGSVPGQSAVVFANFTPNPGEWYHLAYAFDASVPTETLFINGVQVAQQPLPGGTTIGYDSNPLVIGADIENQVPGSFPFNGAVDDAQVFSRVLTSPEISAIYNASTAGQCRLTGAQGPSAWWPGDGDSRDISGNNNNGVSGPQIGYVAGEVGQAMTFNGDVNFSRVTVPDSPSLDPTSAITIEGWVYPTTDAYLSNAMAIILNKETSGPNVVQYEISRRLSSSTCPSGNGIATGNFAVYLGGVSGLPDNCGGWVDGGAQLPLNSWSHVAMTYDGSNLKAYVNGALTNSIPASGSITTTSGLLRLGGRAINAEAWVGSEDEMSLYGRALTANEIQTIFNAGVAGKYKAVATPTGPAGSTANAGSDATVTFTGGVTVAGATQQIPLDPTTLPALPAGHTPIGLYYDISTSATFTGGVTVCFNLPLVTVQSTFNAIHIDHIEGGVWQDRTKPSTKNFGTKTVCTSSLTSLSPFAIVTNTPTAATVSVSGHVLTPDGAGLRNARVTMIDGNGVTRSVITNAFGNYTFTDVAIGQSYVLAVQSRKFTYSSRVVQVFDTLADVDFTPQE
ncbi:MAG: carboxypeptidase regulatory-like domain-containing protein, partial [Acidobacteria bacterium]|nr:carboxypeptidase regulatory-like domain-containing protein [Acidobacteriota bacterium]